MNLIGDGPRTIVEALDRRAEGGGSRPALWFEALRQDTVELSCEELVGRSRDLARSLAGGGVKPRDAVVIVLPTTPEFATTFYGTLLAGAATVPLYPPAGARQVEGFLDTVRRVVAITRPAKLVTLEALAPLLRERPDIGGLTHVTTPEELAASEPAALPPPPRPDDLALIQFSSGSTGEPKGVALSHHNLVNNIRQFGRAADFAERPDVDVGGSWLPLYHDMGLIGAFIGPLVWGFPVALMSPLDFLVRPAFWLQMLSRHRSTISVAPQFAYNLCTRKVRDEDLEGVDLSALRVLLNGAEPVDLDAVERFEERFAGAGLRPGTVMPCYGLAEHALCVSMHRRDRRRESRLLDPDGGTVSLADRDGEASGLRVASSGPAVAGTELRIVAPPEDGDAAAMDPLGDGRLGEIAVRSESVCGGYVTEAGPREATDAGGWLRTGDLGFLSGGELYVVDRIKDMVIAGGRNIYPHDIEREVRELEGLRGRVAVFGHRNSDLGTEALIVAAESVEEDREKLVRCASAIRRRVVESFDAAPFDVVLLPKGRIPLTSSGKVRRHRLRAEYEEGTIDDALYSIRGAPRETIPA